MLVVVALERERERLANFSRRRAACMNCVRGKEEM